MKSKPLILPLFLIFGIMLSGLFSCGRFDREVETTVVKKVVHNSIGWALNKDLDLLYSLVAQDSSFFIFHPDSGSTIIGFDAFQGLSDFWMDSAFQATHFEVRELRIHFSEKGETAWYSCFLDDFAEWNGNPIGWANTRWTGVLEKRNGKWTIMQMHFSFPSDRFR